LKSASPIDYQTPMAMSTPSQQQQQYTPYRSSNNPYTFPSIDQLQQQQQQGTQPQQQQATHLMLSLADANNSNMTGKMETAQRQT